jgi:hypothetical protein
MATFSLFKSAGTFYGVTKQPAIPAGLNNTDVIAPDVKLYIEGVQVPFEAISVNQTYNSLPSADISIPPESGLLDIVRGYEPKVHIFYRDDNYGGFRLLFWGHIKSNTYSRSRNSGSTSISFHCEHKNSVLNQLTLDYSGWGNSNISTNDNPNQAIKTAALNSPSMVVTAMAGISGVAVGAEILGPGNVKIKDAPVDKIDPSLAKNLVRLEGMPGTVLSLWNQIKKEAYVNPKVNLGLSTMYIPLFEEGISYFKRMSGHPLLEASLQGSKEDYCHQAGQPHVKVIIPPCFRSPMISAIQRELAVKNLASMVGFSGEMTSFGELIGNMMSYCKYDINTLASPAEISVDNDKYIESLNVQGVEKTTIETILKPQIPFYYAPTCNVLLPRMYSSIVVNQSESMTPTRVVALHDSTPSSSGGSNLQSTFLAPHSVREALAHNVLLNGAANVTDLNLNSTLGYSFHIPGKYELGNGIRPTRVNLPWWLVLLNSDKESQGTEGNAEEVPTLGTTNYKNMMVLTAEWRNRYSMKITENDDQFKILYDPTKNNLNQNDPLNPIKPYQRILFSTVDYEFSEKVATSRSGTVEALFNPYIIPGYPMDVIDESPNHPSFHGYCTSVSHSITARSISTMVSMVAVTTYAELSNYYTPPVAPFLQTALNMINADIDLAAFQSSAQGDTTPIKSPVSTLIQNPIAKATADSFYRQVLGVGAASPDDLIHFTTGRAYPLDRRAGVLVPRVISASSSQPNLHTKTHDARQKDDYYSAVGNLRLVSRPIESRESIASKFDYKFIDITRDMYNNSFLNYVNPILANNLLLEPGASLFLDYMGTADYIANAKQKNLL